jgi:hypothetical protein
MRVGQTSHAAHHPLLSCKLVRLAADVVLEAGDKGILLAHVHFHLVLLGLDLADLVAHLLELLALALDLLVVLCLLSALHRLRAALEQSRSCRNLYMPNASKNASATQGCLQNTRNAPLQLPALFGAWYACGGL